jgi:hypothetical protein
VTKVGLGRFSPMCLVEQLGKLKADVGIHVLDVVAGFLALEIAI